MIDIARACGLSDARHLRPIFDHFGIKSRSRSEAVRLQWQGNESRRATWGQTISAWKRAHPEEAMEHSLVGNLALQTMSPTSIERMLMSCLEKRKEPFEFQYVVGGKFICDFAYPHAKLIIECDGTYWHSTPEQKRRDASKDAYLRACGYTVMRFSDQAIQDNLDGITHAIGQFLVNYR